MTQGRPDSPAAEEATRAVPCTYCRAAIPTTSFTYWSGAKRLLSAHCPACQRQVTLVKETWRRWSGLPGSPDS